MQALNAAVIRRRAGILLWQQKRSISWFAQVELIRAALRYDCARHLCAEQV